MKKYTYILIIFVVMFSIGLFSATYKGKKIDKKHLSAYIWLKETKVKYKVDVVFVKKAANIVFDEGQELPLSQGNSIYLTLYLPKEEIVDSQYIVLKQVKPPENEGDRESDPDKWEIAAIWIMALDLKDK